MSEQHTLVFVGGVHGVGKTSVQNELTKIVAGSVIYDPGELFWRFHHDTKILSPYAIEKMIQASLSEETPAPVTFVSWHYAVWTPTGYIPQIGWRLWRGFIKDSKILRIAFVLLSASAEEIYERRKVDNEKGIKKRKLDLDCIETELAMQYVFFERHVEIATQYRDNYRLVVAEIHNHDKIFAAQEIVDVLDQFDFLNKEAG